MKNDSKRIESLSKKQRIEQGMNVVAGLDLGDKHSFVCLIDLDGNVVERKKLRTSLAAFERYFGEWAGMRVVWEAGCHSNWVYRLLGRLDARTAAGRHAPPGADHAIAVEGRPHGRRAAGGVGTALTRDVEPGRAPFARNAIGPHGDEGARSLLGEV